MRFARRYNFFFFSSRRRHTRCSRDWSSDVCSSDLNDTRATLVRGSGQRLPPTWRVLRRLPAESLAAAAKGTEADRCTPHLPRRADTLVRDRKSTRLNSSHGYISYAVFCLKKKKKKSRRLD